MKIIFCSSVYNMDDYEEIARRSKAHASLADHNLNANVILGMEECMGERITLINNVQIPNYPKFDKIMFRRQAWKHVEGTSDVNCGFINLPVLKHLSRACTTFGELKRAIKAAKDETIYVITYDLHFGISIAVRLAKKLFPKIKTCVFLPDIPTSVIAASNDGKKTMGGKIRANVKEYFIRQFDAYVFIAEHMGSVSAVANKPYAVVEGIYNNHQPPLAEKTTIQNVIFYSGQLNAAYGMENLLEAFRQIYERDQNYELWICGGGGMADKIIQMAEDCPGVKYFGYVNGTRVRELQAEASVLVNPRQNVGDLTKFSFPSKTMEYLASGRPVIGYKLDGIPAEYDAYIQYVPDNSVASLRDKILEICQLTNVERTEIGERSRKFILENKNPKNMCSRIIEMLEGLTH